MAEYIRTIPQDRFAMGSYRDTGYREQICYSVGCVIGHCTAIDKDENIPRSESGNIDFDLWSMLFTGLSVGSEEWMWCFSGGWETSDNTAIGASKRIEYLLANGLPVDWFEQLRGWRPLCY